MKRKGNEIYIYIYMQVIKQVNPDAIQIRINFDFLKTVSREMINILLKSSCFNDPLKDVWKVV